jgi:hypothetical protein
MRIENQLIGINVLEIRGNVDAAFERIVDAMFDALQQMAKIEGEGDDKDKGQLNYHVILIGTIHLLHSSLHSWCFRKYVPLCQ